MKNSVATGLAEILSAVSIPLRGIGYEKQVSTGEISGTLVNCFHPLAGNWL